MKPETHKKLSAWMDEHFVDWDKYSNVADWTWMIVLASVVGFCVHQSKIDDGIARENAALTQAQLPQANKVLSDARTEISGFYKADLNTVLPVYGPTKELNGLVGTPEVLKPLAEKIGNTAFFRDIDGTHAGLWKLQLWEPYDLAREKASPNFMPYKKISAGRYWGTVLGGWAVGTIVLRKLLIRIVRGKTNPTAIATAAGN